MNEATYEAPSNIALVKYWGLRDVARALPFNSSLSVTLDRVRSRTSVRFEEGRLEDEFILNHVPASGAPLAAVNAFLDRIRNLADVSAKALVRSTNNFPTASGLASSASGFAALAGAGTMAAGLRLPLRRLSHLARFGSGSACRSFFGGFVEWNAGVRADGSDCIAGQVVPENHWPELRDVVTLVGGAPAKSIRSSEAMQATVATAPGFLERVESVPHRLLQIRRALRDRNTETLFPTIMEECDNFRAVCETTRPSLDYLTPSSRAVLDAVKDLNQESRRAVAAYTHDAGAHIHVFTLTDDLRRVQRELRRIPGVARLLVLRPGPGARPIRGAVSEQG